MLDAEAACAREKPEFLYEWYPACQIHSMQDQFRDPAIFFLASSKLGVPARTVPARVCAHTNPTHADCTRMQHAHTPPPHGNIPFACLL